MVFIVIVAVVALLLFISLVAEDSELPDNW